MSDTVLGAGETAPAAAAVGGVANLASSVTAPETPPSELIENGADTQPPTMQLLGGEQVMATVPDIMLLCSYVPPCRGQLYVTNFKVAFVAEVRGRKGAPPHCARRRPAAAARTAGARAGHRTCVAERAGLGWTRLHRAQRYRPRD